MTGCVKHGIMFLIWTSCLLILPKSSEADVTVYTDATAFADALATNGLSSQTLDFESITAGSLFASPSTIAAVTFQNFGPPDLIVTDDFATTSGQNYLGVSSTGFANQIVGGFEIDLQFSNSNAIGFFVITGEFPGISLFDNDVQLLVPGSGTALLDVDDLQATIGGTDSVYFIGLIDTMNTFTDASIQYDALAVNAMTYNVDDIVTAIDVLLGDVNRDGSVNLLDVAPFVELLSIGTFQIEADVNEDGAVNLLDVDPFVALLAGG